MEVEVRDNSGEERYEASVEGKLAGFALYRKRAGLIAFIHTEVSDELEGRGVGSKLIGGALRDARMQELDVLPFCPFVNDYIHRHREYADLVPSKRRDAFGL